MVALCGCTINDPTEDTVGLRVTDDLGDRTGAALHRRRSTRGKLEAAPRIGHGQHRVALLRRSELRTSSHLHDLLQRIMQPDQPIKVSIKRRGSHRAEHITAIRTPIRAPQANADAERWIGTVRRECLDWILIFGRRHLEAVLGTYVTHDNRHRPHRSLDLRPPEAACHPPSLHALPDQQREFRRQDHPGGLIHEYRLAA